MGLGQRLRTMPPKRPKAEEPAVSSPAKPSWEIREIPNPVRIFVLEVEGREVDRLEIQETEGDRRAREFDFTRSCIWGLKDLQLRDYVSERAEEHLKRRLATAFEGLLKKVKG